MRLKNYMGDNSIFRLFCHACFSLPGSGRNASKNRHFTKYRSTSWTVLVENTDIPKILCSTVANENLKLTKRDRDMDMDMDIKLLCIFNDLTQKREIKFG